MATVSQLDRLHSALKSLLGKDYVDFGKDREGGAKANLALVYSRRHNGTYDAKDVSPILSISNQTLGYSLIDQFRLDSDRPLSKSDAERVFTPAYSSYLLKKHPTLSEQNVSKSDIGTFLSLTPAQRTQRLEGGDAVAEFFKVNAAEGMTYDDLETSRFRSMAQQAAAKPLPTPSPVTTPVSGSNTSTRTNTSNTGANTSTATGPDNWFNLPAGGELWDIDGKTHVVYQHSDGPYVAYTVPDQKWLTARFPNGVPPTKKLTRAEANRLGTITIGTANLLSNDLSQTWQDGFDHSISRVADAYPWLDDGEVVAVMLAATLEGREVTDAELEQTEWFASRTDAEVTFAAFAATATPAELRQYNSQYRATVRSYLTEAGVRDPDGALVNFISTKWASGQWNESYAAQQIIAVSNPYSSIKVDKELRGVLKGAKVDTLRGQAEAVKEKVKEWLGPVHGNSYSENWYRQWAGAIMDDPNAENDLLDLLKGQRMALYPEYENSSLTYNDISQVWKNEMLRTWGRDPQSDGDWSVLDKVIRANDSSEAGKILRSEGLTRGVQNVQRDAVQGMLSAFGGQSVPTT